jgi:hypothetical protein
MHENANITHHTNSIKHHQSSINASSSSGVPNLEDSAYRVSERGFMNIVGTK